MRKSEKKNNPKIVDVTDNVFLFPCLLMIPRALDEEEFLHYLKEIKKRRGPEVFFNV